MNERVVRPAGDALRSAARNETDDYTSQEAEIAEPRHAADGLRPRLIPAFAAQRRPQRVTCIDCRNCRRRRAIDRLALSIVDGGWSLAAHRG